MSQIVLFLALFLAIFWAVFLFWRACRHEFIESEQAFDVTIVASIGAIIAARIFDFVLNINSQGLSFAKFIFFNAYGGFDFRGAILGAGVATFLFFRRKKNKTLHMFDLAATPIVFGQFMFYLVKFLIEGWERGKVFAFSAVGYFLIFVILKRLASRKRHAGFFVCFWLVAISILDISRLAFFGDFRYLKIEALKIPLNMTVAVFYLAFGLVLWHLFSNRTLGRDIKNLFALVLLSVFRFKRMIVSVDEAGNFSRSIVLFPLFVSKFVLNVIKLVLREMRLGIVDFLNVLGLRHDRY